MVEFISNSDSPFIEELRPRSYFGQTAHPERYDGIDNDQTRSPLQEYIDRQERPSEEELLALFTKVERDEKGAREQFTDRCLKIIRGTVRRTNLRLNLDEDELIDMTVCAFMEKLKYLRHDPAESFTGGIGKLASWSLLGELGHLMAIEPTNRKYAVDIDRLRRKAHEFGKDFWQVVFDESETSLRESISPHILDYLKMVGSIPIRQLVHQEGDNEDIERTLERSSSSDEYVRLVENSRQHKMTSRSKTAWEINHQQAFLYYFLGLSIVEIADKFKITSQAVHFRITRYIKDLRRAHAVINGLDEEETRKLLELPISLNSGQLNSGPRNPLLGLAMTFNL